MPSYHKHPIFSYWQTCIVSALFFCVVNLSAQRVLMENYTMENGLATNVVHNIFQDSNGFMWFMTRFGLSRYDGARFTNFTIQNGLASNYVSSMYEDDHGVLYVASDYSVQQMVNGNVGANILNVHIQNHTYGVTIIGDALINGKKMLAVSIVLAEVQCLI